MIFMNYMTEKNNVAEMCGSPGFDSGHWPTPRFADFYIQGTLLNEGTNLYICHFDEKGMPGLNV